MKEFNDEAKCTKDNIIKCLYLLNIVIRIQSDLLKVPCVVLGQNLLRVRKPQPKSDPTTYPLDAHLILLLT